MLIAAVRASPHTPHYWHLANTLRPSGWSVLISITALDVSLFKERAAIPTLISLLFWSHDFPSCPDVEMMPAAREDQSGSTHSDSDDCIVQGQAAGRKVSVYPPKDDEGSGGEVLPCCNHNWTRGLWICVRFYRVYVTLLCFSLLETLRRSRNHLHVRLVVTFSPRVTWSACIISSNVLFLKNSLIQATKHQISSWEFKDRCVSGAETDISWKNQTDNWYLHQKTGI